MLTPCVVIHATQISHQKEKNKPFYSVKLIFQEHWKNYLKAHQVRVIEQIEVEKMLSCKDGSRGGFWYYCKNCDEYQFVPFGCNSRLCSCCGKRYTDQWASMLSERLEKNIFHRHLVFGIPDMLWNYFHEDRKLFKILMDTAYKTIKETFSKVNHREVIPGVIEVYHPFGRDIKHQPHVHMIVSEGGYDNEGKFISSGNYIPYNALHKNWEYNILKALRKSLPQGVVEEAYRKYPNGFCVYVRKDRISSRKGLAKYIGRYVRHPAIANARIIAYNGEAVKFYWKDHEDKIHFKIMLVHDFISAIIQHVPEKNQKLVRYYGAYSRRKKKSLKSSITKLISMNSSEGRVCYCPKCCERMEFVFYSREDVPPDKNLLSSWLEV
ncbi:MAG: transposase [Nanoarchaeota archaeon]|nr:transposase [Nanoarchaeota archaeon]